MTKKKKHIWKMSVCFLSLKKCQGHKMHASLSCLSVYIILFEKKEQKKNPHRCMHVENCLCLIRSMPFSFRKTHNQLAAREQKEQNLYDNNNNNNSCDTLAFRKSRWRRKNTMYMHQPSAITRLTRSFTAPTSTICPTKSLSLAFAGWPVLK